MTHTHAHPHVPEDNSHAGQGMVVLDIGVRAVSAALTLVMTRGGVVTGSFDLRQGVAEFGRTLRIGMPLMLGSFIVTFMASVVRIVVERTHPAEEFANYALAFSFINVLMVLGAALSTVLFPHLASASRNALTPWMSA